MAEDTVTETVPAIETPAAPAPEAVAPAPAEPSPEPKKTTPISKREARQAALKAARGRLSAPAPASPPEVEPAPERPAAASELTPAVEPKAPTPPQAEQPKAEEHPAAPAAEPKPQAPTGVEVKLDPKHPASMGRSSITVLGGDDERVVRALINGTYTRTAALKDANERAAKAETRLEQLEDEKARWEAATAAETAWKASPDYEKVRATYEDIKANVGQAAADDFLRGAQVKLNDLTEQEYKQRADAARLQRQTERANRWIQDAYRRSNSALPEAVRTLPVFRDLFDTAIRAFDAEIGLGQIRDASGNVVRPGDLDALHKAFIPFFQARLVREPSVQSALKAQQARKTQQDQAAASAAAAAQQREEAIKRQAVEDFRRQQAEQRAAQPPHPLGALGSASRPRAPQSEPSREEPPAGASAHQIRKAGREAARERARTRLG